MPVFIYEKNAFRKFLDVECRGDKAEEKNFLNRYQEKFGSTSFFSFLSAWHMAYVSTSHIGDIGFAIHVDGHCSVYGWGGLHRYYVERDGEMVFSAYRSTKEGVYRAKKAGFRISGGNHV